MQGEIENKGLQLRAAATLLQSKAQLGILNTLPLTQEGFDTYNSPSMRQKFSQLGLPYTEYKTLQDYQDGIQSITDASSSIYGNATSYAMMVRQNTDPNSPNYGKLASQIQAMHDKIVHQGQARAPKTPAPTKLSDGDIRGIIGQNLGLRYPDVTKWGSNNPAEYKNLIDGITGQVQAQLRANPKADPNQIAQQYVGLVERKDPFFGKETFTYHPPLVINGKSYEWHGNSTQ